MRQLRGVRAIFACIILSCAQSATGVLAADSQPATENCNSTGEPVSLGSLLHTSCEIKTFNRQSGTWEPGCQVGAPINPANGEVYLIHRPEFAVQSEGSKITFFRTYRSQLSTEGLLGKGWRFNYETSVRALGSDQIEYLDETGKRLVFDVHPESKGRISIPSYPGSFLTRTSTGFTLETPEHELRDFEKTSGHLVAIRFPSGQTVTLRWSEGLLREVRDHWGRTLTFSYSGKTLQSVKAGETALVTFRYDSESKALLEVLQADGSSEKYEYSRKEILGSAPLLTRARDGAGTLIEEHRYDDIGQGVYSASTEGTFSIQYGQMEKGSREVLVANETTRKKSAFRYDDGGRLLSREQDVGIPSAELNRYNAQGQLIEQKKNGIRSEIAYENGKPATFVQRAGGAERKFDIRYDADTNLPVKITESSLLHPTKPKVTTMEYDGYRLMRETEKGYTLDLSGELVSYERQTRYRHNSDGQLVEVRLPDGRRTSFSYYPKNAPGFDSGRVKELKTPDGQVVTYTDYDFFGTPRKLRYSDGPEVTLATNPMGKPVRDPSGKTYAYDSGGKLDSITYPSGEKKSYHYGKTGELVNASLQAKYLATPRLAEKNSVSETHPVERLPHQVDERGNLVKIGSIDLSYDLANHLTEVKWPNGSSYKSVYDDRGRLVEESTPEFGAIRYQYDEGDRLIARATASGQVTRIQYDEQGRIETEGSLKMAYYPAFSEPRLIRSPKSDLRMEYDQFGRVVEQTVQPAQSNAFYGLSVAYDRDASGQIRGITYPDGFHLNYEMNPETRLLERIAGADGSSILEARRFDSRRPAQLKLGPVNVDITYTADGHVASVRAPGQSYDFRYEGRNLKQVVDLKSSELRRFELSPEGYLTGVTSKDQRFSLKYDQLGNLQALNSPSGQSFSLDYDPKTHLPSLLHSQGKARKLTYDGQGRLVADGTRSFEYDSEGRLESVQSDDTKVHYGYDPLGRRLWKNVNGTSTYFFYDDQGRLLYETTPSLAQRTRYIYRGFELVALQTGQGDSLKEYYILNDHHLTPLAVYDSEGAIVARARYENPFSVRMDSSIAGFRFHFGFPGQYRDDESGLVYNVTRYLDTTTGRYLTPDPKGIIGGANLYQYARSNPATWIDVLGTTASEGDALTVEDAPFCKTAPPTNAAKIDPHGLPDDGSVYRVGTNRWTLDSEKQFADWVRDNVDPDFLLRNQIATDCADATMVIRTVFARIHQLPALFTNGSRTVGHFSKDWRNLKSVPDWTGDQWKNALKTDQRFRAFLDACSVVVDTTSLIQNTYPIRIADEKNPQKLSQYMHEGSILLTNDHARFVSRIERDGSEYLPVYQMDSTVPKKVRSMNINSFDIDYPAQSGRGVLNWRWPVKCPGKDWKLARAEDMPGFSVEQYSWTAHPDLATARKASEDLTKQIDEKRHEIEARKAKGSKNLTEDYKALRKLNADLKAAQDSIHAYENGTAVPRPASDFRDFIQALGRGKGNVRPDEKTFETQINMIMTRLKSRVELVQQGADRLRSNPRLFADPNSQAYDDFSTNSRDSRVKTQFWFLKRLADNFSDPKHDLSGHFMKLMMQSRVDLGEGRSISLLAYWRALQFNAVSPDPNDSVEKRWGVAFLYELPSRIKTAEDEIAALDQRNQSARRAPAGTPVRFADGSSWPIPADPVDRERLMKDLQGELEFKKTALSWLKELQREIPR